MARSKKELDFMGTSSNRGGRKARATRTKRVYTRRNNASNNTVQVTIPSDARAAFTLGYQIAQIANGVSATSI